MTTQRKGTAPGKVPSLKTPTKERPVGSRPPVSAGSVAPNAPELSAEDYRATALDYAARGWRVFPCKRGASSKKPDTGKGGFHHGTQDRAQIDAWWPDGAEPRNIGAVPPTGHFVVDVDLYKPEANDALRALAKELHSTGAALSLTGAGGAHFLFRGDPPTTADLRHKVGCNAMEVVAQNGYVILPPSVHPTTGKRYVWKRPPDAVPIAPVLPMLYSVRRTGGPKLDKKPVGFSIAEMEDLFGNIPPKEFDSYAQWFGQLAAIHHETGASDDGLELAEKLTRQGKYTAADKWPTMGEFTGDMVTMHTFARMAERYGWRSPRSAEAAMAEFTSEEFLRGTLAMYFDHANEPPAPPFAFRGVFPLGKVSILAGTGGAGKSYLALSLGAHYVAQKSFGPWFVPEHHGRRDSEALLLFAEEDRADIEWRYFHAMQGANFSPDEVKSVRQRLHMKSLLDLRATSALAEYSNDNRREVVEGALLIALRRVLVGRPMIRLVVLDPMLVLHKLEENDNGGMAALMLMVAEVAHQCGCAIVLTHHFSKTGAKADVLNEMSLRGASAISSEARAVVVIRAFDRTDFGALANVSADEIEHVIEVSLPKHNYAPKRDPFYLRTASHGEVSPISPQPVRHSPQQMRELSQQATAEAREQASEQRDAATLGAILAMVAIEPEATATAIYAADSVPGSRRTIEPVLHKATQDGLIETTDGKRNALHHRLTTAGRAALRRR